MDTPPAAPPLPAAPAWLPPTSWELPPAPPLPVMDWAKMPMAPVPAVLMVPRLFTETFSVTPPFPPVPPLPVLIGPAEDVPSPPLPLTPRATMPMALVPEVVIAMSLPMVTLTVPELPPWRPLDRSLKSITT
ncbi:hypothetical protein D9M68_814290 [compost metagenome]